MRRISAFIASLFLICPAYADFTAKDGSGATITFKNPNTCSAAICVPIAQPVDSTGAAFGVTGNPFFMSFGTGVTLPAYAATPTFNLGTLNGAATAAKQPALGTAGTPSADVISIQGVAGGIVVPVSAASLPLPTGSSTSANQASQITQETATAAALGTTTDAVGATPSTGSAASLIALAKAINNNVSSAIPAGTNLIGKVGIDQTTPGTTNGVQVNAALPAGTNLMGKVGIDQTTPGTTNGVQVNAALPTGANVIGGVTQSGTWNIGTVTTLPALPANQSTNEAQINGVTPLMGNGQTGTGAQRVTLSQDGASAPINVSTATDTQIVALSGSTVIYITSFDVVAGGTGNITFEYGTGSNCATGKTALTGAYPLTAQAGIAKGSGVGTILKVPSGNALCVLTSAAVQMSGSVSYIQF